VLDAFTRAVSRTQRWLAGHDAQAIAAAIASGFPETEALILARAVARYHGQGTWARDPLLRRPGYDYLEDILLSGGFIARRARYEDLVDTVFARRAMEALGAP
jgi:NitT/TauT family transport system substrate-binding protein